MGPLPLRCGSGGRRRIGALTDGSSSGGIRRTGLGAQGSSCPITSRLRRWTRWSGSMTSCGWHGWPARSSRANLSRPARLPLVADQVSSAVTLAAMARQVFSLLPAHHPSVGAHRRPERVGSAFSLRSKLRRREVWDALAPYRGNRRPGEKQSMPHPRSPR